MEITVFLVGIVLCFLLCASFVAYEAYKGGDWKSAAMFMIIGISVAAGILVATGQLLGGLK